MLKNWNKFGRTDPLWAIMTHPDKKGNKWEREEFFETGVKEIENIMKDIQSLDIHFQTNRALDFGCGIGRLTQALAIYFEEVYGIDIAPSMIKLAKEYKYSAQSYPGIEEEEPKETYLKYLSLMYDPEIVKIVLQLPIMPKTMSITKFAKKLGVDKNKLMRAGAKQITR